MPILETIQANMLEAVIVAVLIIATISVSKRREKKVAGVSKGMAALILGVLAVGVALQGGLLVDIGFDPLGDLPTFTAAETAGGIVAGCAVEDTTVTLNAQDKETATATGGTHRYKINGGISATVSDGGTFTASPGDNLEVLYENAATGVSYYSQIVEVTVPCKGTFNPSQADSNAGQLSQNGTFTVKVFNQDGNSIDGVTNETVGAGDARTLKMEINAQNKRAFPYGGVLIVEYNDSDFDSIDLASSEVSLAKQSGVPSVFSLSSTDNTAIAYEIGALEGSISKEISLSYDADDTNNPGNTNDPVITFYPANPFIDDDNGGAFAGPAVEDEDNVRTYGHTTTFTLHLN